MNKRLIRIELFMFFILMSLACSSVGLKERLGILDGLIYFDSDHYGNSEIFSINPNTRIVTRLTNNTANDFGPFFNSSKNKIGFSSDYEDGYNYWQMDAIGENMINITKRDNITVNVPRWSVDGKVIVTGLVTKCLTDSDPCDFEIFLMNSDGSALKNLTHHPTATDWYADMSPDGQKILFVSDRSGDPDIYVMDKDGTNLTILTENNDFENMPRWSPDGSQIVFVSDREGGDWDIFIMNSDGSKPKIITTNTSNDYDPCWSPDGKWLVYVSDYDGDTEIMIMDVNGQNQRKLTNNFDMEHSPFWAPEIKQ